MKHSTKRFATNVLAFTSVIALTITPAVAADHHSDVGGTTTTKTTSDLDPAAARFVKEAWHGNKSEVAMGKLGMEKGQNAQLKSFAQQLQQDHSKANEKLTQIAHKHGVVLEASSEKSEKAEKHLANMRALSGAEFDRQFALMALKDHQKDIAEYQHVISKVEAPDVKQYAQDTLPKLKQHLTAAAQVAKDVGIDQATISQYTRELPEAVGGSSNLGDEDQDSPPRTSKGAGAQKLKEGPAAR